MFDLFTQKMISRQFIGVKVIALTTSDDKAENFASQIFSGHDLFPARPLVLKDGRQLPDNYSFLVDGARATTLGSTAHRRDTGGLPKLWTKTRVEYF